MLNKTGDVMSPLLAPLATENNLAPTDTELLVTVPVDQ